MWRFLSMQIFLMSHNEAKKPANNVWYKNYMVIIFVIGLPVFVLVTCIFFIIYALKIQDSTVRDDWYMDGKALYQDASKDQRAYDMGVSGIMRFTGDEVRFELKYPPAALESGVLATGEAVSYPATLNAVISHATNESFDRDLTLTHQADNVYTGTVSLEKTTAKYYIQVSSPQDSPNSWRLIQAHRLPATAVLLKPLEAFAVSDEPTPIQTDQPAQ